MRNSCANILWAAIILASAVGPARATDDPPTLFLVPIGAIDLGTEADKPGSAVDAVKAADKAKADDKSKADDKPKVAVEKKWYEKYSIRGYTQIRDNEVLREDSSLAPAQVVGDRSIGSGQNFSIRRARLILFGDMSEHLYLYFQPDFSITPSGSGDATFFAQLRDLYGDIYLTKDKVHRVRAGLSKVPYGFENMQSSQNRMPLDRADGLNSAVRNERDLGLFYYWTPEEKQALFKSLVDDGLRGSGNYGIFAFGAYDGQGGSFLEQNENIHLITRLTYPFCLDNGQIVEMSVQAYTGKYVVFSSPIRPQGQGTAQRPAGTFETGNRGGWPDQRVAGSFIYYAQPLGFQTEWTVGRGPALNEAQTAIETASLTGGYAMAFYRHKTHCWGELWPFCRYSYFRGGYKSERNAPYSRIDEWEFGVEWQIVKSVEFTTSYLITDRTNTTDIAEVPYRQFDGSVLRFQLQINY